MLISFLCGVLPGTIFGLIGVGSGILAILLFSNVLGVPIHLALPLALLLTLVASLYTVCQNCKKAPIQKSGLYLIISSAVLMAIFGVYISKFFNAAMLKTIFNVFIIFSSFMMWPRSKCTNINKDDHITKTRYFMLVMTGAFAGVMNALLGISGGIIILPLLTYAGFSINRSVVTSAYVVLFTTIASLIFYFVTQRHILSFFYQEYIFVIMLVVGCVVGSAIGNKLSYYLPSATLKKIFSILVFCIAIFSLFNLFILRYL